jgi:hypothetical protein
LDQLEPGARLPYGSYTLSLKSGKTTAKEPRLSFTVQFVNVRGLKVRFEKRRRILQIISSLGIVSLASQEWLIIGFSSFFTDLYLLAFGPLYHEMNEQELHQILSSMMEKELRIRTAAESFLDVD